MQKITPFLWFNDQAEEAMEFYTSIFRNSKKGQVRRYGEAGPGPAGSAMSAEFELDGQGFIALNGGPHFPFTPAVSFFVNCETHVMKAMLQMVKIDIAGLEKACAQT